MFQISGLMHAQEISYPEWTTGGIVFTDLDGDTYHLDFWRNELIRN